MKYWTMSGRVIQTDDHPCQVCHQTVRLSEPDACLGYLPGASHACCGHGHVEEAYVVLGGEPDQSCLTIENYLTLRGCNALEFFDLVKAGRQQAEFKEDLS